MKRQSKKQAKLYRDNREWRQELIETIGRCQLPDCHGMFPHDLCVHEIGRGASRTLSFSRRIVCMIVCSHCNSELLTDYTIWPIERQAALQCLLLASEHQPNEILSMLNFVRGRAATALTWADVAAYLRVL